MTSEQLHTNFIKLAKLIHPDYNTNDPTANEKFQKLQEQYQKAQKLLGSKNQYQASISISLKEAIFGTERYFITHDKQRFVLNIPAGVRNKQSILYRRIMIHSGKNEAILHIKVFIKIPTKFSIIGNQLILKESVSYWKLFFGGQYRIQGIGGNQILINIPKRTKSKKMFKVQNEGLWDRVEKKRYPLYIQFFGRII